MPVRKLIVKAFVREVILDNDNVTTTYNFTENYTKHRVTQEIIQKVQRQSRKKTAYNKNLCSYKLPQLPPQLKGRADPVLLAVAEEYNNEPLRRKRVIYFFHKIMRRRVRRRADAPAKETPPYSRDAFARTTLKEECSLLFALSFFAVSALWRISRNIQPFGSGARARLCKKFGAGESTLRKSFRRV